MASRFDFVPRSAMTSDLRASSALVLEHPNLRPHPALQHDIEIAVAVDIGEGERAAVLGAVDAADTGEIVVAARRGAQRSTFGSGPAQL